MFFVSLTDENLRIARIFTELLAITSSAINPLIYAARIRRLRVEIKRLLHLRILDSDKYDQYEIRRSIRVIGNIPPCLTSDSESLNQSSVTLSTLPTTNSDYDLPPQKVRPKTEILDNGYKKDDVCRTRSMPVKRTEYVRVVIRRVVRDMSDSESEMSEGLKTTVGDDSVFTSTSFHASPHSVRRDSESIEDNSKLSRKKRSSKSQIQKVPVKATVSSDMSLGVPLRPNKLPLHKRQTSNIASPAISVRRSIRSPPLVEEKHLEDLLQGFAHGGHVTKRNEAKPRVNSMAVQLENDELAFEVEPRRRLHRKSATRRATKSRTRRRNASPATPLSDKVETPGTESQHNQRYVTTHWKKAKLYLTPSVKDTTDQTSANPDNTKAKEET